MQNTLSITIGKEKIVSKPWDFEALCMVQENQLNPDIRGIGKTCGGAVDHLFEGTKATQEVLDANPTEKMKLCQKVWAWYIEDMTGKNVETAETVE